LSRPANQRVRKRRYSLSSVEIPRYVHAHKDKHPETQVQPD
jgi:hypothetical protein